MVLRSNRAGSVRQVAVWTALAVLNVFVLWHLAGSAAAAAVISAFVLLFFVPAAILASRAFAGIGLPPQLTAVCGTAAVFVGLVPWYFLRKAIGWPVTVDVISSAGLLVLSWRFRHSVSGASSAVQAYRVWLFGVIPSLFAIAWLGWAVVSTQEVRFYGLFVVDFGNLTSVVTAIRTSPMLPEWVLHGAGPLGYHWPYFAVPALISDWLGGSVPHANALVVANLIAAMTLFVAVRSVARTAAGSTAATHAAAVVLFASSAAYAYQAGSDLLDIGGAGHLSRNHLLLTPVNSMIVFGNNTLALVLCIVALSCTQLVIARRRLVHAAAAAVSVALIAAYSVTLVFPMAIGITAALLASGVRRAVVPLLIHAGIGAAVLSMFLLIRLFDSPASGAIAFAFDDAAFLRTVAFSMLPLLVVAAAGARIGSPSAMTYAALACLLVPTVMHIPGTGSGHVAFSMKTATLIAATLTPAVARSLEQRSSWIRLLTCTAIAVGAVHTLVYVGQFAFYRVKPLPGRAIPVARDHYAALVWLRSNTPLRSVVLDSESLKVKDAVVTSFIGERRVWLPTQSTRGLGVGLDLEVRHAVWGRLLAGRRLPSDLLTLESATDYVVTRTAPGGVAWRPVYRAGGVTVFEVPRHRVAGDFGS